MSSWIPFNVRNHKKGGGPQSARPATPQATAWKPDLHPRTARFNDPARSPDANLVLRADIVSDVERLLATLTPVTVETWFPLANPDAARDLAAWTASQGAWVDWRVEAIGAAVRVSPIGSPPPLPAGNFESPRRQAAPRIKDREEERAVDRIIEAIWRNRPWAEYWFYERDGDAPNAHHDRALRVATYLREHDPKAIEGHEVWASDGAVLMLRNGESEAAWRHSK